MAIALEDLRALQTAEAISDAIWARVIKWNEFAKDTVGKQLARISRNRTDDFITYRKSNFCITRAEVCSKPNIGSIVF